MNKNIYLYNNTFISLLNLIKILLQKQIIPLNIKNQYYEPNLFDQIITLRIPRDEKIINIFLNNFSPKIVKTIYYLFCSENENKEIIIYYFLVHSLKYKDKIFYMRNFKSVSNTLQITKYVSNELHKLKGFLRFKQLDNKILYAEISPENNILFLLSEHFQKRLKNEYWLIKDVKRKIYSIYDKKQFILISEDNFKINIAKLSEEEKQIQNLWKEFYKTIGINERKNERCRQNFMPKKYWKYIIEMEDDYEKSN